MPVSRMTDLMRHLRRLSLLGSDISLTDGQLLESFIARRDETAFEALVRRHGLMVFGVCKRILRDSNDAEDAFQATFLVLVRKAASIVPREMVGNWLYGVAFRTAMKAKASAAKRRAKERRVQDRLAEPTKEKLWEDLLPVLDKELNRLPDKYRLPIVLCDLEGKSRTQAARQLGWPVGTVSTRLVRGRTMLAKKLARYGLALSAASLAASISQNVVSATMPVGLVTSTVKAAAVYAAGNIAAGLISAKVAALTEGVLKSMLLTKLKTLTAVLLGIGLVLGTGVGSVSYRVFAAGSTHEEADEPQESANQAVEKQGVYDLVWDRLGLKLQKANTTELTRVHGLHGGMKVVAVRPDSPASEQNVRKGDILVGLHHWEATTNESVPFTIGFCQGAGMKTVKFVVVRKQDVLRGEFSLAGKRSQAKTEVVPNLRPLGQAAPAPMASINSNDPERVIKIKLLPGKRSFNIAMTVDPSRRSEIKQLNLLASNDKRKGQDWVVMATIGPDQDAFPVTVPEDGLYWLCVQIVKHDGTKEPSNLHGLQPQSKMLVETGTERPLGRLEPPISDVNRIPPPPKTVSLPDRNRRTEPMAEGSFQTSQLYRTEQFLVDAARPHMEQEIARVAERLRKEKAVEWLGRELPLWMKECHIDLRDAEDGHSKGFTSFAFGANKVLDQHIYLEGRMDRLIRVELPREMTHVVLANYFRCPVPRWADEGAAILSSDDSERNRYDRTLRGILNSRDRFIPLARLFRLRDYPEDATVLLAEGYSVTTFLVESKDRKAFLAFVAQGMKDGWDIAAKAIYGYSTVEELEAAWLQRLKQRAGAGQEFRMEVVPGTQLQRYSVSFRESDREYLVPIRENDREYHVPIRADNRTYCVGFLIPVP